MKTRRFSFRGAHWLRAWLVLLACVSVVFAQDSPPPQEGQALVVVGVVGPKSVVLTRTHSSATKPVAVILQNQSAEPLVLADATLLRSAVVLQLRLQGDIPDPEVTLTLPRSLPYTLQPQRKMLAVFQVKFSLGDASPGRIALGYSATVREDALTGGGALAAALPIIVRGADNGAVVQVSRQFVALRKGASQSDPIKCNSKWNRGYFQSGWENSPADAVADSICSNAGNAKSVSLRWAKPGNYVVQAFLVANDGSFDFANPTIDVHVVRMSFTDDSTLRVGITTPFRVRRKSVSIRVEPASEANNVKLQVKGSGSSRLTVVSGKTVSGGTVTFMVEGTGTDGSLSEADTQLEATISTVPGYTITRNVTVTRPFRIADETGDNFTGGQMVAADLAVGQGTFLPAPAVPTGQHALVSWYGWRIHVHVVDRFGRDVDDLYAGEPVSEVFLGNPTILPINVHLQAGSFYVDWVGFQVAPPGTAIVPAGDPAEGAWTSHITATYPLPPEQSITRTQFTARVGPFALIPNLVRTTILNNGTLRVGSNGHDTGRHIGP